MLSHELEAEIAQLAARYGKPQRVRALLEDTDVQPLCMNDRFGEVCMAIRRPNGKLLTAIKTFYPPECYRLLTGGVKQGEPIEDALWREIAEETNLLTEVDRFLAVIEYAEQRPDAPAAFVTFVFLLDERGGMLTVIDEDERVADFRELAVDELPALADTLEHVATGYSSEIEGDWHSWGVFRAVVHHVVYAALQSQ